MLFVRNYKNDFISISVLKHFQIGVFQILFQAAICQDDSPNASSLSDDEDNIQLHTEQQSDSELMLSSFIFMLDIILKQVIRT